MNATDDTTNVRSLLALIFGILGIVGICPCVGSIAALLLGMGEKNAAGRAGFHLGWISLVLAALAMFGTLLLLAVVGLVEAFN